ncbi:MAG: hypothetical protein JSR44_11875 [Spirochaetes bacterium]|nr:hypothetical protein [Spirochaetota bacterium]
MQHAQNISAEKSIRLDAEGDLELWLLGLETRDEFNAFVLKVYNDAFAKDDYKISAHEIAEPTAEYFHRARVCGVRHKSGTLIGEPMHFWNRDRYPCAFQLGAFKDYMRAHHPERYAFLYERAVSAGAA